MGQSVFKEVEASKIQEGRMLASLDSEFSDLTRKFLRNLEEYGWRKGVKAALTLEITLVSAENDGAVGIQTQIKQKQPTIPANGTFAMVSETQTGEKSLFAQSTGTSKHNPRQTNLLDEGNHSSVQAEDDDGE